MSNPEGAGVIKYVKSLGNGQNLIVNQVVERFRESYLKRLVESRHIGRLLLLVAILLCFGLLFGVMLIHVCLPVLRHFILAPELPHTVIFYFMLLAVSPIMRITYLYSSTMRKNVIAQFLIAIGMGMLFLLGHDQPVVYLVMPVTLGLVVFVSNLVTWR